MINRLCDWFRELLIAFYRLQLQGCERDEIGYWWGKMKHHIDKRSDAQIERMERERGLINGR